MKAVTSPYQTRGGKDDDLLSEPLLREHSEEDEDTEDEDDEHEGRHRSRVARPSTERLMRNSYAQNGYDAGRIIRSRRSNASPGKASTVRVVPPTQDYRSEGEQPSTARGGARRKLVDTKQDSFRAARMPKRGGRKRLRRVRAVRRKIRVSSYCVARELQTLKLLRWLESQPSRRLSQALRAEGGSVPLGPIGAAPRTAIPATHRTQQSALSGEASAEAATTSRPNIALDATARMTLDGSTSGERFAKINQIEWMDSLYIDVIHSTTDLRGGLHKAQDLDRPARDDFDGVDDYAARILDESADGLTGINAAARSDAYEDDDEDALTHKDVVIFPYGCVVFWGCSEAEEKEMLAVLRRFIVGKVSHNEFEESFDDMTFVYRHSDSGKSVPLKNDEITLETRDPTEKLAYSCALAQSAKLFVFEERLNGTIESTAKYPELLASTGKIPLSEVEIGRLIGKVLCERNEVNLHSDILDTPEYFWEEDVWEPAYQALCAYLDIPLRVDNLNKRLDILSELLDVLSTQSTNAHATRLEVIIIYLIFVEVAIELVWNVVVKDILHLIDDCRC